MRLFLGFSLSLFLLARATQVAIGQDARPATGDTKAAAPTAGQVPAEDPIHNELRALRDALAKAINAQDIDGVLAQLHPNIVVIWQNAEVSRGHKGVREYYERNLKGPSRPLNRYTVEPSVAELSILYGGDTAIAYGTSLCHFDMTDGRKFDLNGPWSATAVKDEGRWRIASFHSSAGLFDNPLLLMAKQALYWGIGLALLTGLVLGYGIKALLSRGKRVA